MSPPPSSHPSRLLCTFFGTTTLYITDGSTAIFIDAFFSRPSLLRVKFGQIAPDLDRIDAALSQAKVSHLDGIFVAHTHYDHVMDAPTVIQKLGGRLFGSSSTLNVGLGAGLAKESMQLIAEGEQYQLGQFKINILEGIYNPGDMFPGTVEEPFAPPAPASSYKTGKCYTFHIVHPGGSILVHSSANFVPDKFKDLPPVDVFYLGIGFLGKQKEAFQKEYLRHTAESVKSGTIIPVHWDNLAGSILGAALQPLPWFLDRFSVTKELLESKAEANGWKIYWQKGLETIQIHDGKVVVNELAQS